MRIKDLLEKSAKEKKKAAAKKVAKNVAMGAGIGTAVGLAAGVLLAPKAGKETRDELAKGAKEILNEAKEKVNEAKEIINEAKEKVVAFVEEKKADEGCCEEAACCGECKEDDQA